jgi:hypothetical protein
MFGTIRTFCTPFFLAMLMVLGAGSGAFTQDAAWRVSKLSGEVSVTTSAGQKTALANGATLNPGDTVSTGQNGRVLLVRGEETMLVSPNSVIGIPVGKRAGMTTIIHQAGSILLEVEKRNVKHFEVETPYLAAVVKGTKFLVTVANGQSSVEVVNGQVEVTDFKSGQFALVQPNQAARVLAEGVSGLFLSGPGEISPVQHGTPRRSSVSAIMMPSQEASAAAPAQPVRVAQAETRPSTPSSSSSHSGKDDIWSSSVSTIKKFFENPNGRRSKEEDFTLAFAFACSMGIGATAIVATRRRLRNRDKKPK